MDMETLAAKILAEKRGEIPPGSVTIDELRAALQERRAKFAKGEAVDSTPKTKRAPIIEIKDGDINIDL